MKESEGETYLELDEVKKRYTWGSSTLYLFRGQGLIESYKFVGDKKSYWKVSELEAVSKRPPEATKRGPKPHALTTAKLPRARELAGVGV